MLPLLAQSLRFGLQSDPQCDLQDDPSWSVDVEYVTEDGNVVADHDDDAVAPEPAVYSIGEMYTGASGTGNIVFEVPEEDSGLLRVAPGMIADHVFVSTK